jgi:hypothetical protein
VEDVKVSELNCFFGISGSALCIIASSRERVEARDVNEKIFFD